MERPNSPCEKIAGGRRYSLFMASSFVVDGNNKGHMRIFFSVMHICSSFIPLRLFSVYICVSNIIKTTHVPSGPSYSLLTSWWWTLRTQPFARAGALDSHWDMASPAMYVHNSRWIGGAVKCARRRQDLGSLMTYIEAIRIVVVPPCVSDTAPRWADVQMVFMCGYQKKKVPRRAHHTSLYRSFFYSIL